MPFPEISVTSLTDGNVMPRGLLASQRMVRIVACRAGHRAAALLKTCRLTQAVRLIHDLKLLIMPGAGGVIEMDHVVGKGLSWPGREHAAIETAYGIRKPRACGL